jgi:hypothetical protein
MDDSNAWTTAMDDSNVRQQCTTKHNNQPRIQKYTEMILKQRSVCNKMILMNI